MQNLLLILALISLITSCNNLESKLDDIFDSDKSTKATETTIEKEKESSKQQDKKQDTASSDTRIKQACLEQMGYLPNPLTNADTIALCESVKHNSGCNSVLGKPIVHYDKESSKDRHIKVLVLGTIHGDEGPAGSLARDWIHRLQDLEPRSNWRILPITNPDGLVKKTRVNANGVDVNRNFPTDDWFAKAQEYWRSKGAKPRRFPGNAGGSEPETQCIVSHIKEFKPDFIISIHTPYGVLDFDGPNVIKPATFLPWRRLGHMPGSLGRFMWKDEKVPVLTIELQGADVVEGKKMEDLQDIIGTVAIRSLKSLGRW